MDKLVSERVKKGLQKLNRNPGEMIQIRAYRHQNGNTRFIVSESKGLEDLGDLILDPRMAENLTGFLNRFRLRSWCINDHWGSTVPNWEILVSMFYIVLRILEKDSEQLGEILKIAETHQDFLALAVLV